MPYSCGRIILSLCANIDVLEETIDGKNTFNCTQMRVWKRGPVEIVINPDISMGRKRAINSDFAKALHVLDYAVMPVRIRSPPPQINNFTGVNLLEYRDCTDEINYAHANNLVWLIFTKCI